MVVLLSGLELWLRLALALAIVISYGLSIRAKQRITQMAYYDDMDRNKFGKREFWQIRTNQTSDWRKASLQNYRIIANLCVILEFAPLTDKLADGRVDGRADGLVDGRADGLADGQVDGLAKKGKSKPGKSWKDKIAWLGAKLFHTQRLHLFLWRGDISGEDLRALTVLLKFNDRTHLQ